MIEMKKEILKKMLEIETLLLTINFNNVELMKINDEYKKIIEFINIIKHRSQTEK